MKRRRETAKEAEGSTRILSEACNFKWSIENFSVVCKITAKDEENYLKSPTFTTGSGSSLIEWCGVLRFPKNNYIEVFVERISSETSIRHLNFHVSIIGSDKKQHVVRHWESLAEKNVVSWGCSKFIQRNMLFEEKETLLLPNDTLTVMIVVKVSKVDMNSKLAEDTGTIYSSVPSLIGDLRHIYENQMFSDFTVKVGNEELKVHKVILSGRSSVFNSMLNCDMKESINNCLEITDFDSDVVKTMLRYLYCGQVEDLTPEMSVQLFSIADKYNLQDLKNVCREYLLENLDVDNICTALVLAERHNEQQLMKAAKSLFCANAAAIQETEPWLNLSKEMPDLAISMYRLVTSQ